MKRATITYYGQPYECRCVATVHIDGGKDQEVWAPYEGHGFMVADAGVRSTPGVAWEPGIRQALSLAVRNAGWG